jgi:holliday junction DNA helicase RuvA
VIGRIQGRIVEKSATRVLVDVHGVGYEIDVPLSTYLRLGDDDTVTLRTHLVVREDGQQLVGFYTDIERVLFRALIKVNRVGPKLALTILSGMEAAALVDAVRHNDVKALAAIPGVGKKIAEQMILDLRDALPAVVPGAMAEGRLPVANSLADAESALIGLGFKPQQAALALSKVADPGADVEVLIKAALKLLR